MAGLKFDAVLFDLDGTLTESGTGITRSAAYALEKLGAEPLDEATLMKFVGPPLFESFMKYGRLNEEKALEAVRLYRERYSVIGWKENRVYTGIAELVRTLKAQGAYIALASSKPQHFCEQILEYFGLAKHFDAVCAITPEDHHADKAATVRKAIAGAGEGKNICMVGDRLFDVEGAHANGIHAIGVAYGYGSREELENAGADDVADTVADLRKILLGDAPVEEGVFITFEGGDGCGKSTQLKLAGEYLAERGYDVVLTREPGGCAISERIRDLVLDIRAQGMTDACEALLFAAARVQVITDTILPALKAGKIVLCDRYVDSSFAYQAHGRELGEDFIRQINAQATEKLMPVRTLLYELDEEKALGRMRRAGELDRIEVERGEFTRRVETAFREMAEKQPERFIRINADGGIEEVFEQTKAAMDAIFFA